MSRFRHPHKRLRVRGWIAKQSWLALIFLFLFALLVAAALLAVLRGVADGDLSCPHLLDELVRYVLVLIDAPAPEAAPAGGLLIIAVGLLTGLCKLLLIVILLGVVVFKLTVLPPLFVHRKKVSIHLEKNKRFGLSEPGWLMVLRIYNSTELEIIDIHFEVILRVPLKHDSVEYTPNLPIKIVEGRNNWPIAIPFVPFSICIPLYESDIDFGKSRLKSIQKNSVNPEDPTGVSFLVLLIRGKTPEVDSEIVETHWFRLSEIPKGGWFFERFRRWFPEHEYEIGKFKEITVKPGRKPKKAGSDPEDWAGWKDFEKSDPLDLQEKSYIFGYGSLVNEQNLRQHLNKHGIKVGLMQEGLLRGYRRAWNVAMDNLQTIAGYKYFLDPHSQERPHCFVTFLNIYPSHVTSVNGIAFEVKETDLEAFDQRERNYKRIDVSDRFEPRLDGKVWTYIATLGGRARYQKGKQNGTAVIQDEYIAEIEQAFRSRGDSFYEQYAQSTDPPKVPCIRLERIDIPR